jgi:hypothetical protein
VRSSLNEAERDRGGGDCFSRLIKHDADARLKKIPNFYLKNFFLP